MDILDERKGCKEIVLENSNQTCIETSRTSRQPCMKHFEIVYDILMTLALEYCCCFVTYTYDTPDLLRSGQYRASRLITR